MIKMDPHVYSGRPADETGRLQKELRVYDLLDELGIAYERVDHEAAMTVEDCQGVDRLLGIEICKNLFLTNQQKTKFYLLLMPGQKRFVTKEFCRQIGSARLSFGKPELLEELLDLTPGSVSIMGLMNDRDGKVQLVIDREVYETPDFGCHPCINTTSLKMSSAEVWEKFLPAVGHEPILVDLKEEQEETK
ncbi:MAG: prolyl-tRNA synthetase associated domain-containing protein [Eubacteriales bacterium]|nr:prolyl-tRNA synthetase associated domain-containing protein [Eubacteriales bacterium]